MRVYEKLAMKRDQETARKKALEVAAKEKAAAEDSTVSFPEISKEG
jgi:hypothetical protein